jgi:ribosomal protein L3 glutamine methyltransferase
MLKYKNYIHNENSVDTFLLSVDKQSAALMELYTLRDVLRWGFTQFQCAKLFYGHGTDNAWDEIIYLVLAILRLDPILNQQWLDARLTREECTQILEKIAGRINKRIPTAYLVNKAWFAGYSFYVDERVLIPRSPIAELIEQQFRPWIDPERVTSILDVGTGSGCIAIACAHIFPNAKIEAIDCSEEALTVAAMNVVQHKLSDQINLIRSNSFENVKGGLYDIVISNPPYVDAEDFVQLPPEYRHEPTIALAAGTDGLDLVVQLLIQAKHYLKKGGILIVEVGNSKPALMQRFPSLPFVWLEFERGDAEVFLLTQSQLMNNHEI